MLAHTQHGSRPSIQRGAARFSGVSGGAARAGLAPALLASGAGLMVQHGLVKHTDWSNTDRSNTLSSSSHPVEREYVKPA